jgi:hypothetical protein
VISRESRVRLGVLACVGMLPLPAFAQQPVGIKQVKQLDTGMQFCIGDVPAFEVSQRGGTQPALEVLIVLKTAPDTLREEEIPIRIDLLDADGQLVEMADSAEASADSDPPWLQTQSRQQGQYLLALHNRRPRRLVGPGFKIRVSTDSIKARAKESRVFQLYWNELGQQLCKPLTGPPEVPDES